MESSTLAVSTTSTEAVLDSRCPAVFNVLHAPTTIPDSRLCLDDNDNDGRLQQQLMRDEDDEEDEEEMAEEERLLMVLSEVRRAYSLLCDNVCGNGGSEFIRRLETYSNTSRSNEHDCINCSQCPSTHAPVSRTSPSNAAAAAAALGLDRQFDAINHNDFLGLQSAPPAMSRDLSTMFDIDSSCSDRFVFSDSSRQGVFRSDSTSPSLHASNSTTCCTQTFHDPRRPTAMRCCRSVSVPPFLRPIEEEDWSSGGEETAGGPDGRGDRGGTRRSLRPGSIAGFSSSSSSNADDFARNEYYLTYSAVAASVGVFDAASSADSLCPCGGLATVCLCPEPAAQSSPLELSSLVSSSTDDTTTSQLDTPLTNSINVTHSTTSGSADDLMMTTCDVSESSNKEKLCNASLTDNNSVARVGRNATNSTSEMTSEVARGSLQDVESDHTPHSLWFDDQPHLFYVLLTTSATFVACLTALPPSCLVTLIAFVSLIGFRTARL